MTLTSTLSQLLAQSPWLPRLFGAGRDDESDSGRFAHWLPYRCYVPETQIFVNRGGLGVMLELMPQSGADERMVELLAGLVPACPAGTGLQVQLLASPHLLPALRRYAALRWEDPDQSAKSFDFGRPVRNDNLFRLLARRRVEFLTRAAQRSLTEGFYYTLRDFRVMLSLSIPGDPDSTADRDQLLALRDTFQSTLQSALLPSVVCNANDLINWCKILTNPEPMGQSDVEWTDYDDGRELRDQIIDNDTLQDPTPQGLLLSKHDAPSSMEVRFFSVKNYPQRYKLWEMGALIGDQMQSALQYRSPFLITMGLHVLDPVSTKSQVTGNHVRATQNAQSKMAAVMPDVAKKLEDWSAVAKVLDTGGALVNMYHQLAVFAPPDRITAATEAARAVWRSNRFLLNADLYLQRLGLLASLPMSLSEDLHRDLKRMRRVTRKTSGNAVHLAPLVAEWRGTHTPTLVMGGRRGQLMALDLYDNELGNPNFSVIGAPGSGKSVLLNELAWSYRAVGAKVTMLELGRSFEKLCTKAKGEHVDFEPSRPINMNPFTKVHDINDDIEMLVPAIAKMCAPRGGLDEVQHKAISAVVMSKFREYGQELTMTGLRDAFLTGTIAELGVRNDRRIRDLGLMLNPYARGGQYERYFEGPNSVDLGNDFVVIETEHLKRKPELHQVVNILLLYQITGEMFLTRNHKKLFIIDELKAQIGDAGLSDSIMVSVVEETARRARKYGGALGTATQGADDYYCCTQMEAAFNCSDWVFMMRQKPESIELLERKGRLSIDPGKKRLLTSLRTEPGVFSETYISSPVGEGIGRLVLDPATLLLFSNKLEDNEPLDRLRASGMSIDEAICALLKERGQA